MKGGKDRRSPVKKKRIFLVGKKKVRVPFTCSRTAGAKNRPAGERTLQKTILERGKKIRGAMGENPLESV